MTQSRILYFVRVDEFTEHEGYALHKHAIAHEQYLLPRTPREFQTIVELGNVFAVRDGRSGTFVGMCYIHAFAEREWEIGGLFIEYEWRRAGIGEALLCLALTYAIVFTRPWVNGDVIATYVSSNNGNARTALEHF